MKQIKYEKAPDGGYILLEDYVYYSKRYNRYITLKKGMWSDGATGFVDLGAAGFLSKVFAWFRNRIHHMSGNIKSPWFFVHDQICNTGLWDDGTKVDNWTASTVAGDLLWKAGYRWWSVAVWHATYLLGGGEAKKNGMRRTNLI
jgi:hypothetical protein